MTSHSPGEEGRAEHGKHEGPFDIIVNGQQKRWNEERISFSQVVNLAYPGSPAGGDIVYTVTYSKGPSQNPQGTLLDGQSVRVKDRMVFDVVKTVKS